MVTKGKGMDACASSWPGIGSQMPMRSGDGRGIWEERGRARARARAAASGGGEGARVEGGARARSRDGEVLTSMTLPPSPSTNSLLMKRPGRSGEKMKGCRSTSQLPWFRCAMLGGRTSDDEEASVT